MNVTKNLLLWGVIALVLLAVFSRYVRSDGQLEAVRYSTFMNDLRANRVDSVVLQGDMIYGIRKDKTQFKTYNPETDYTALIGSLIRDNVAIEGHPQKQPNFLLQLLLQLAPVLLLALAGAYGMRWAQKTAWAGAAGRMTPGRAMPSLPIVLPQDAEEKRPAGSLIAVTHEGGLPRLIELQALVTPVRAGVPVRNIQGPDAGRVAMLLAVLARHSDLGLDDQDVFVNAVGGLAIRDPAADLPLVLALAGSRRGDPLPARLLAFGEVDLSGEVRPVPHGESRLKEAAQQGFRIAVVPHGNAPAKPPRNLTVIPVSRIEEAIKAAFA